MTKADKILERMRANPLDWRIEDLQAVAERYGIDWRQPGTSHVTFSYPDKRPVTVPSHKPIKPIYIKLFLALLDSIEGQDD